MAGRRASLRIGLIGGAVLSLAVIAQQFTDSTDLQFVGFMIVLVGLFVIGILGSREEGDPNRWASVRAGGIAGLISGLVASLAVMAALLVLTFSGVTAQRIYSAIHEAYTPEQLAQYAEMGLTMDVIAETTSTILIICCPAGLPIAGVILGALGGALNPAHPRES